MGIGGWRVKKTMKHPERGILQVTEVRDGHNGVDVTGIITAPGIRPTVVEHKSEDRNRWAGVHKVPVMVDRADPSKFEVLWYEVESGWSEQDEPSQQVGLNSYQPNSTVNLTSTFVTTGPDGTTVSTSMSPEAQASVQALLSEAFGKGNLLGKAKGMRAALNEIRNQALSQGAQWTQGTQGPQWSQEAQWTQGAQAPFEAQPPFEAQGPYGAQGPGQPGGYVDQGFPPPPDSQGFPSPPDSQGFPSLPDSQAFPQVDPRDFGAPGYPPEE